MREKSMRYDQNLSTVDLLEKASIKRKFKGGKFPLEVDI